jgi:hypothetical protein
MKIDLAKQEKIFKIFSENSFVFDFDYNFDCFSLPINRDIIYRSVIRTWALVSLSDNDYLAGNKEFIDKCIAEIRKMIYGASHIRSSLESEARDKMWFVGDIGSTGYLFFNQLWAALSSSGELYSGIEEHDKYGMVRLVLELESEILLNLGIFGFLLECVIAVFKRVKEYFSELMMYREAAFHLLKNYYVSYISQSFSDDTLCVMFETL